MCSACTLIYVSCHKKIKLYGHPSAAAGLQPLFDKANQIPRRHFQCVGETKNRCDCWAFFGTLNGTYMTALSSRTFGKLVLRERLLQA